MKERVVVVTGASSGVGRATAVLLARRGARVALLARGEDGLAGASADVAAAGGVPLPLRTDVADAAQVEAAAETVERELGPIDVWINNAMTTVFARFLGAAAVELRRVQPGQLDGRDPHRAAGVAQLAADRVVVTPDCVLGAAVGRLQGDATVRERGSHLHDRAPVTRHHPAQRRPRPPDAAQ